MELEENLDSKKVGGKHEEARGSTRKHEEARGEAAKLDFPISTDPGISFRVQRLFFPSSSFMAPLYRDRPTTKAVKSLIHVLAFGVRLEWGRRSGNAKQPAPSFSAVFGERVELRRWQGVDEMDGRELDGRELEPAVDEMDNREWERADDEMEDSREWERADEKRDDREWDSTDCEKEDGREWEPAVDEMKDSREWEHTDDEMEDSRE